MTVLVTIPVLLISGIPDAHATAGAQLWVARYVGPGLSPDKASGLAMSLDGSRVFVTGTMYDVAGNDYRTVGYDASTGAELWAKRYDGPAGDMDMAAAIGVSPDGSKVFVTGWSRGTTTGIDYATLAYDSATGARLWAKRYTNPVSISDDQATALGVSPDGSTVFVTGTSDGGPALPDFATIAYSASTGQRLWTARHDTGSRDSARVLSVSPDGSRVFVTGSSVGPGGSHYLTVAYEASTGDQRWAARYHGHRSREDQPNAMSVSPDGSRVFVTGFSGGSNRKRDFATVSYSASTGAQRWVRRFNGPGDFNDNGKAVGVSPDGSSVFVTGYSTSHDYRDAETIAYDASTGARLWLRHYNGPDDLDDQGMALGVSPDGRNVFVTGFTTGATSNRDYVTIAYRASTGAQRWLSDYDAYFDVATALRVSPDGSTVFVSGTSGDDFTTLAYATT